MKNILRVFPARTSYTPDDNMAFIGMPPMPILIPEHDEVHISCTFTWDMVLCEELAYQWEGATNKPVRLGGPAYGSPAEDFTPGMYTKRNVVFTTRGCNNNCPWCCVPKIEGRLRELSEIQPGNIIQDNNFLQASQLHKIRVFEMLKKQRGTCFKGGLQADLVDHHFIDGIRDLSISELLLACDTDARLPEFKRACRMLASAGFSREKIKCYVLIRPDMKKDQELEMERAEQRLAAVYEAGAMPFAQLYRDFSEEKTVYPSAWNAFARMWQRPAATRAHMEKGTNFRDFNT